MEDLFGHMGSEYGDILGFAEEAWKWTIVSMGRKEYVDRTFCLSVCWYHHQLFSTDRPTDRWKFGSWNGVLGRRGLQWEVWLCTRYWILLFTWTCSVHFVSFGFVALTVFLFHSICSNYHYNHTFSHVSGCIWMLINSWL